MPSFLNEIYKMDKPETTKEKEKGKGKSYTAIAIGPTRNRFSDCCNEIIENHRCPSCGNWFEDNEGRREIKIKGLDGRSQPTPQTAGSPPILFKSQSDKPKESDKMPKYFKQLQESGKQIRGWTASDT